MEGNVQKMREVAELAMFYISQLPEAHSIAYVKNGHAEMMFSCDVLNKITEALSVPPRNCDVGTAEEQFKRWQAFCNTYDDDCTGCPCDDGHTSTFPHCFAKWAQMPFKEGGAE